MPNWIIYLLIGLSFAGFAGSLGATSYYASSSDNFSKIQPILITLTVINSVAAIILIICTILYFSRFPAYTQFFNLGMSGIAMFMSFMAVSVSVLTKTFS
jgi:hypothetical protein